MSLKALFRDWLPPAVLRRLLPQFGLTIRYRGEYATYADAARQTTGYAADDILEQVRQATAAVRAGKAVAERDGVLLAERQLPYPVLAELMHVAACNCGRLSVCDFGGSLGSVYRTCAPFLDSLPEVRWGVVEQEKFVRVGLAEVADERLGFFQNIAACQQAMVPQVLLLSSVLQYLEEPLAFLREINAGPWRSVILDRTPFRMGGGGIVTVQTVPARWVSSSYPSWLLDRAEVLACLPEFEIVGEFPSLDGRIGCGRLSAEFRGMILRRPVPIDGNSKVKNAEDSAGD